MWDNRDELRRQGVLLPGASSRAAPVGQRRGARGPAPGPPRPGGEAAWGRLVEEINAWDGTAVVSHEFFAAASAEQAARAAAALAGAEVHVVVTARETLSLVDRPVAGVREERLDGADRRLPRERRDQRPNDEWDWGTLDLADVLRRWGAGLPPERVHVLTLPRPG